MLVLSRKAKQSIMIEDVKVTIVSVSMGRVKIGIEADDCIKILRAEIVDKYDKQESS